MHPPFRIVSPSGIWESNIASWAATQRSHREARALGLEVQIYDSRGRRLAPSGEEVLVVE